MGIIAKRPLANVAWAYARRGRPRRTTRRTGRGCRALDYGFLRDPPATAVATALRFTLAVPGVHTAIVGTAKPDRWGENAALLAAGPLPAGEYRRIRRRWRAAARSTWVGQV